MLNIEDSQIDYLVNFMGHAKEIHKSIYRMPIPVEEMTDVSRLLEAAMGTDLDNNDNEDCDNNISGTDSVSELSATSEEIAQQNIYTLDSDNDNFDDDTTEHSANNHTANSSHSAYYSSEYFCLFNFHLIFIHLFNFILFSRFFYIFYTRFFKFQYIYLLFFYKIIVLISLFYLDSMVEKAKCNEKKKRTSSNPKRRSSEFHYLYLFNIYLIDFNLFIFITF